LGIQAKQRRNGVSDQACWRVVIHIDVYPGSAIFLGFQMDDTMVLNN